MAWDVLENVVIGNFILGFGRALGVRYGTDAMAPIGVELLQQTPLDTSLGDVLIANATFVRLIEFKRELNRSPKERAKLRQLRTALESESTRRFEPISRQIHWYVVTNFNKWPSSKIVPYLDMEAPREGNRDLARFVQETADALAKSSLSERELQDVSGYMKALAAYCGTSKSGKTTGGLLFAVNAQGRASYTPIRDVRELAMEPQMVLERHLMLERERVREHELRPTLGHGPSLSL